MKQKFFFLILSFAFCTNIFAQEFIGFVKKADSTSSPIFQAKVEVSEAGKSVASLKTYFDGSFKFTLNKDKTYTIKISYAGYTDTSYTITSDKNGNLSEQNVTVKLKKDGMRLMGVIKSREEDFPIKDAVIVLKNIMTQQEDRISTDIDGKYNFKLEYETNYKVWIDKRSKGIFNVYKDTSFYISTVGFNMPLDYKLDIALDPIPFPSTTAREGYDAMKKKTQDTKYKAQEQKIEVGNAKLEENLQSVVEKTEVKDTVEKVETKKEEVKNPKLEEPTVKKEKKKKKQELEVVVIRDNERPAVRDTVAQNKKEETIDELEAVRQKALATQKAKEAEAEKLAQQKLLEDSLLKVKQRNDSIAEATIKQKLREDSIARVNQRNDSVAQAQQRLKAHNDSLLRVKTENELKAKQDSVAQKKITPANEPSVDSAAQNKMFYLPKTQEELIAAAEAFAKRKKFLQDSIAKAKALELQKDTQKLQEKK